MNKKQWKKINRIVDTALDLEGEERDTYIQQQCQGNRELKDQVTEFLKFIKESDTEGFLEDPEVYPRYLASGLESIIDEDTETSFTGKKIGNYRILELIGHGGMGSVYLADRADEMYQLKVAFKVIRRGMNTPSNIARFKRERAILANLDHPGIAKLLDGGITEDGLPYMVMEYVEGTPLYDYCDDKRLSIQERLTLFKSICDAVQHAHQNAIIHRDLKPSNILVTGQDQIKILDFGIAKLVEPESTEQTLYQTQTGARLLTLGYAAPEQVKGKNITTATDTYTLGILLFELLTGAHLHNLEDKNFSEIEQVIRTQTPPTPSAKIKKLPRKQQEDAAVNRNSDPSSLIDMLQGDLDAIVTKALRKEPEARYGSTEKLLEDLDRREQNRPIIAREDTFRYKIKKFIKRHKTAMISIASTLLIVAGIVGYYTVQLSQEKDIAQRETRKAEEVTAFLTDLIETNYPENAQGDTITVREFLDRGFDRVQELDESPEVKAHVMQVMAHTYRSLGEIDKAGTLIGQAVEIHDTLNIQAADKAKTYNVHGLILRDQGDMKQAEKAMENSLNLYRSIENTNSEEFTKLLRDLAYIKRGNGNYDEAANLARRALEIEEEIFKDPNINSAETHYVLASILRHQKKYEMSKENQLKSLQIIEAEIDGPHPGKVSNYNNLAIIYEIQDSLNKAEYYYRKSLTMAKELYHSFHPEIANIVSNFSTVLLQQGKIDSAQVLIERAIEVTKKNRPNHPRLGEYLSDYANIYTHSSEYPKADSLYDKSLEILRLNYKDNHPDIVSVMHNKARNLHLMGKKDEARKLLNHVVEFRQKKHNNSDDAIQEPLQLLLTILDNQQQRVTADSLRQVFSSDR